MYFGNHKRLHKQGIYSQYEPSFSVLYSLITVFEVKNYVSNLVVFYLIFVVSMVRHLES